ncbi:hypothetical protein H0H92_006463 [Tricholoma furcatifolium]|nr:hypothetical protein H0H92_006463 [Tricholoma furcatifolium]
MAETSGSQDMEENSPSSYTAPSEKDYASQAVQQRVHLPPISHPPYPPPPPHVLYPPPNHLSHMGPPPAQYYYPHQGMIGPGQPPQPPMQPYIPHVPNERPAYYPAIDPNIDGQSSSGPSGYPSNSNTGQQDAGPSGASLVSTSR